MDELSGTYPSSTEKKTMSLLLDLLGRKYDKEGPKTNSFSSPVTTLGVVVNVELTNQGLLEILRNAKRVRSL